MKKGISLVYGECIICSNTSSLKPCVHFEGKKWSELNMSTLSFNTANAGTPLTNTAYADIVINTDGGDSKHNLEFNNFAWLERYSRQTVL
jgi:hypothetical protein